MNIIEIVEMLETIENPQNIKITRDEISFYMSLGKSGKYFYFFKKGLEKEEALPYNLTLKDLKADNWYILTDTEI